MTEGTEKTQTQEATSVAEKIKEKIARRKRLVMRELELKRLKRIRKKTRPAYTYCKNCGTELKGMYCHKCGQYALDVEQPFWKYIKQYFENVYQFDSKVWSTLWQLFRRPGFLTNEFNAGKIASYVHPLRLLMFITVLFFLFVFLKIGNAVDSIEDKDIGTFAEKLSGSTSEEFATLNEYVDWYAYADSADGKGEAARIAVVADSSDFAQYPKLFEILECTPAADPENAGQDTLVVRINIPEDLLAENGYATDKVWNGLPLYEPARDSSSGWEMGYLIDEFLGYASKWIPIMVLLLSPVMAFVSRVLYRKSRLSYMGNFVYVLHLFSFFFIVTAVYILLATYLPLQMKIWTWALAIYTLFYTTVSAHRVYAGTGWIKDTVKSLLMWISFIIIIAVALIILTILIAARLES